MIFSVVALAVLFSINAYAKPSFTKSYDDNARKSNEDEKIHNNHETKTKKSLKKIKTTHPKKRKSHDAKRIIQNKK